MRASLTVLLLWASCCAATPAAPRPTSAPLRTPPKAGSALVIATLSSVEPGFSGGQSAVYRIESMLDTMEPVRLRPGDSLRDPHAPWPGSRTAAAAGNCPAILALRFDDLGTSVVARWHLRDATLEGLRRFESAGASERASLRRVLDTERRAEMFGEVAKATRSPNLSLVMEGWAIVEGNPTDPALATVARALGHIFADHRAPAYARLEALERGLDVSLSDRAAWHAKDREFVENALAVVEVESGPPEFRERSAVILAAKLGAPWIGRDEKLAARILRFYDAVVRNKPATARTGGT